MNWFRAVMAAVTIVCLLPLASLFLIVALENFGACDLDEGSVQPCVLAGINLAPSLDTVSVGISMVGLATFPVLAAVLCLWAVAEWFAGRAAPTAAITRDHPHH